MAGFHTCYDLLLRPGLAPLPVKLGSIDMMMDDFVEHWRRVFYFSSFTVWFNITGRVAIMLPLGRSSEGLSVVVQAVTRRGDEATLSCRSAQLEEALTWFAKWPVPAA